MLLSKDKRKGGDEPRDPTNPLAYLRLGGPWTSLWSVPGRRNKGKEVILIPVREVIGRKMVLWNVLRSMAPASHPPTAERKSDAVLHGGRESDVVQLLWNRTLELTIGGHTRPPFGQHDLVLPKPTREVHQVLLQHTDAFDGAGLARLGSMCLGDSADVRRDEAHTALVPVVRLLVWHGLHRGIRGIDGANLGIRWLHA